MGQYVQEGRRNLVETVLQIKKPKMEMTIGEERNNFDGFNWQEKQWMKSIKVHFKAHC